MIAIRLTWFGGAMLRRARQLWFGSYVKWRLRMAGAVVGRGFSANGAVDLSIHPTARVRIGDNVRFISGFGENPCGGFRRLGLWVGPQAELSIESGVGISNSTLVAMHGIRILESTYIGGDCAIYDTDFHSLGAAQRLVQPDVTVKTAPITIGPRAFIGGHAIVLKGVAIGSEAVVGAGSVVTKTIPAQEIWAGNPARRVGPARPTSDLGPGTET